jgi:hypothetical protein
MTSDLPLALEQVTPDRTPTPRGVEAIPDDRIAAGLMNLNSGVLREAIERLTPRQKEFIRCRAMADTDARARHFAGRARAETEQNFDRPCACGVHAPHWIDMRERTLMDWKKYDDSFMFVYTRLVQAPTEFAVSWLESLSVKAVVAYHDLLEPNIKPEVRRLAAKDILEANDVKPTVGVQGSGKQEKETASFQLKMAIERARRGRELSPGQLRLLLEAGHDPADLNRGTEVAPGARASPCQSISTRP